MTMGNEIEVKGIIGLDPPTDPLTDEEMILPEDVNLQATVVKEYPQTNDQIETQMQFVGIWLILIVVILTLWHNDFNLQKRA